MSKLLDEYLNLKKSYPNHLLLYRMGGFYELYFDDAILVANQLSITLNHKKIAGRKIPSCGFPVKSLNIFSNKLLKLGFKIAIAEQFMNSKNPKQLSRKVSKILTSGTVIDDDFFNVGENILLAIAKKGQKLDLCFGNILMGDFYLDEIEESQINQHIEAINPAEIITNFSPPLSFCQKPESTLWHVPYLKADPIFHWNNGVEKFKIDNQILQILNKYNNSALRLALEYITSIHNSSIIKYFKIYQYKKEAYLKISTKTLQNLQINNVIKIIDRTNCLIGKRFLKSALIKPLTDAKQIQNRLDAVEFLSNENDLQRQLKNHLQSLPDLEKIIGKIAINKNANFSDLSLTLQALQTIAKISEILFHQNNSKIIPQKLADISRNLIGNFGLINFLKSALDCKITTTPYSLQREPVSIPCLKTLQIPVFAGITHYIRCGFDPKLDYWKNLQQENLQKISALENEYKNKVKNLKIEFSETLGFYFEIKREKLINISIPKDWQVIQNLDKSVRFSSQELKNHQLEIADLSTRIQALEKNILQELTDEVLENIQEIKNSCKAVGLLDLLFSFAILAKENNYIKPIITNQNQIKIIAGKYLISDQFVENDCNLSDKKIWLITGANMAGKSTFLRQNVLIAILAQAGCFVPAKFAEIGIRKEIFVKITSPDNLCNNTSSFMAEMLEVAEIIKKANEKSLIIIDEICQATNSQEGSDVAFRIINYLHNKNKSLALISTHHLDLSRKCLNLKNTICKKIDKTHKMTDGVAKKSSAIEIARQAGLDFIINN